MSSASSLKRSVFYYEDTNYSLRFIRLIILLINYFMKINSAISMAQTLNHQIKYLQNRNFIKNLKLIAWNRM